MYSLENHEWTGEKSVNLEIFCAGEVHKLFKTTCIEGADGTVDVITAIDGEPTYLKPEADLNIFSKRCYEQLKKG